MGQVTEDWRIVQLRQALQNLAAAPEEQRRALFRDGFQVSVDELGLDLGDAWERLQQSDALTSEQRAAVRKLLDLIHEMSGKKNAELWTRESLDTSAKWKDARALATAALRSLPPPTS